MTFQPDMPKQEDWEGVNPRNQSLEDAIIDPNTLSPDDAAAANDEPSEEESWPSGDNPKPEVE